MMPTYQIYTPRSAILTITIIAFTKVNRLKLLHFLYVATVKFLRFANTQTF